MVIRSDNTTPTMEINNMNARARKQLVAGGALGAMLIGTVALSSAAMAEPTPDDKNVDVSVNIEAIEEPGVLAFSVAAESTSLTEGAATPEYRQFTGTLPTVTVTDTRDAADIPEGSAWAVLGEASEFTGDAGQAPLPAGHLGWTPNLIEGDELGDVTEGQPVGTVLDDESEPGAGDNVGLVDQELLVSTFDSASVAGGTYSVDAGLTLKTPLDVEAGTYSSVLTLSLFE